MVKNLPAVQETQVQSLGQEDPQEKGMATHSRILAWRTPWTEEPAGLQSMSLQRIGHDSVTFTLGINCNNIIQYPCFCGREACLNKQKFFSIKL